MNDVRTKVFAVPGAVSEALGKGELTHYAHAKQIKRVVARTTTLIDNDVLDLMFDTYETETP